MRGSVVPRGASRGFRGMGSGTLFPAPTPTLKSQERKRREGAGCPGRAGQGRKGLPGRRDGRTRPVPGPCQAESTFQWDNVCSSTIFVYAQASLLLLQASNYACELAVVPAAGIFTAGPRSTPKRLLVR